MLKFLLTVLSLVFIFGNLYAQDQKEEIPIDGHLHTPDQIIKLLDQSKISYILKTGDSDFVFEENEPVIIYPEQFYLNVTDDRRELVAYHITEETSDHLLKTAEAMKQKDIKTALIEYQNCLKYVPQYWPLYTYIGDCFYMLDDFDSAAYYFQYSLDCNYYNYSTHWFYADLLYKAGQTEQVIDFMTTAHLLNRNHPNILEGLKLYRAELGKEWNDWSFKPQYQFEQDGDQVTINIGIDDVSYVGYILVKALWEFEPGYREKMQDGNESFSSTLEEKEAILGFLANDTTSIINDIISDGYVNEFILYEIMAPKSPRMLYLLPEDIFARIKEYVNKYH